MLPHELFAFDTRLLGRVTAAVTEPRTRTEMLRRAQPASTATAPPVTRVAHVTRRRRVSTGYRLSPYSYHLSPAYSTTLSPNNLPLLSPKAPATLLTPIRYSPNAHPRYSPPTCRLGRSRHVARPADRHRGSAPSLPRTRRRSSRWRAREIERNAERNKRIE